MTDYYLGQGKLYVARRRLGEISPLRWLGDVSSAEISLATQAVTQKENYSGQQMTAKKVVLGRSGTFSFTLMELGRDNLQLALYGRTTDTAAGSVSDYELTGLMAGERFTLPHIGVSAVMVTDSSTPPKEVAADVSPEFGVITVPSLTGLTLPLHATYQHAANAAVGIFSDMANEVFIRYEGYNLAEDNRPIVLELYRVQTEPLKKLSLIGNKFTESEISAEVMIDSDRLADDVLGQFGKIVQLA